MPSSHGITIEWSTDDVTYNSVGNIRNTGYPEAEADEVDVSTHASVWKQIIGGMIDAGELNVELLFDLADTQHKALRAAIGTMIYVHITAPAAIVADNQLEIYGLLKKCGPANADLGGAYFGPFVVKASGAHTWQTV